MPRRALLAAACAAALLGVAGCGAPDELDSDDDRALATARERLDDALDTEETVRTSPAMGRTLARRVEQISQLAGQTPRVIEELVPSLVVNGEIDQEAADAFVRYAASDAPRALLIPARSAVEDMTETIDDSGADGDTKVPHARDRPLDRYLDEVVRDIREVWPELAKELEDAV